MTVFAADEQAVSYTIVTMLTVTPRFFFFTHTIDKTGFIKQSTRHLHKFKTMIQYLINLFTRNQPTDIY